MDSERLQEARTRLRETANEADAAGFRRFFKTGKGEYGEGDRFLGVRMPAIREAARRCDGLSLSDTRELLASEFHEERMLALRLMVRGFERGTPEQQKEIFGLYLEHTDRVNGWDLVDTSAPAIVGGYLLTRPRGRLDRLARSGSLWERRIAILSTLTFIRRGEYEDTLRIAELLVQDEEDLIHKAVGWMLREVGNRDRSREEAFLRHHCRTMPRTMLRYAIEKFPTGLRRCYLHGDVEAAENFRNP